MSFDPSFPMPAPPGDTGGATPGANAAGEATWSVVPIAMGPVSPGGVKLQKAGKEVRQLAGGAQLVANVFYDVARLVLAQVRHAPVERPTDPAGLPTVIPTKTDLAKDLMNMAQACRTTYREVQPMATAARAFTLGALARPAEPQPPQQPPVKPRYERFLYLLGWFAPEGTPGVGTPTGKSDPPRVARPQDRAIEAVNAPPNDHTRSLALEALADELHEVPADRRRDLFLVLLDCERGLQAPQAKARLLGSLAVALCELEAAEHQPMFDRWVARVDTLLPTQARADAIFDAMAVVPILFHDGSFAAEHVLQTLSDRAEKLPEHRDRLIAELAYQFTSLPGSLWADDEMANLSHDVLLHLWTARDAMTPDVQDETLQLFANLSLYLDIRAATPNGLADFVLDESGRLPLPHQAPPLKVLLMHFSALPDPAKPEKFVALWDRCTALAAAARSEPPAEGLSAEDVERLRGQAELLRAGLRSVFVSLKPGAQDIVLKDLQDRGLQRAEFLAIDVGPWLALQAAADDSSDDMSLD